MKFQKSWFTISQNKPDIDIDDNTEIRFPIELPKKFIGDLTKTGAYILDPFAGYGTTLFAAEELGRVGIGIEYEEKRAQFISEKLQEPSKVICGDSRNLSELDLPQFDLCFTSPPYMRSFDEENPLTNYHESGAYKDYLSQMALIFEQVKARMKPGAYVLVEVENTYEPGEPMTPLAWDIGKALSKIFFLEREIVCCFEEGDLKKNKVNHSSVLVFVNK